MNSSPGLPNMPAIPDGASAEDAQAAMSQSNLSSQSGGALPTTSPSPVPSASPPRTISSPLTEAKYMAKDVAQGLMDQVGIGSILSPKSTDNPEKANKRRQIHSNWTNLSSEQQQIAMQKANQYRQELAEYRHEQLTRPTAQEQANQMGGGSGMTDKQRAMDKLQQDRQSLGGAD